MLIYERESEGGGKDDIMQLATSLRGDIHSLCARVCLNKSPCVTQLYDRKSTCVTRVGRTFTTGAYKNAQPNFYVRI